MNILLLSFSLHALSAPDRWFSADKAQHFFMGTFVQGASFAVLRAARIDKTPALTVASAISATAAIGKEFRDRGGRGDASAKDAIWTLTGALAISPILARTK